MYLKLKINIMQVFDDLMTVMRFHETHSVDFRVVWWYKMKKKLTKNGPSINFSTTLNHQKI